MSSIDLTYPWLLLLLPLPFLVMRFSKAYKTKQTAIKVPFFQVLIDTLNEKPSEGASMLSPRLWQRVILVLSWCCLVLAMTKPTQLSEPQLREQLGRDVMIALDLSGSMNETDFVDDSGKRISRIDAAKQVLQDFSATRQGDRLGLILFADAAFLQTPFTADIAVWQSLLTQSDTGMAGQSTHLGDAIGLSIKVFEQAEQDTVSAQGTDQDINETSVEKVVILLTDGNDTGSFVAPIDAAKVAAVKGIRVHVIAMGDPLTVGEQALDMETIDRITSETGGSTFTALDKQQLDEAYQAVSLLEPQLFNSTSYQITYTLHHYLVIFVVMLYLLAFSASLLLQSGGHQSKLAGSKVVKTKATQETKATHETKATQQTSVEKIKGEQDV
ncbi:VWA domain-containing protein [Shewanella electrodiphila]|uniref:VWA domain-containing protein n=1 Tax=Shewanella electrodiphila TaxID=934143 RepID=A0ABT0KJU9_9GAMM|nr:VWA domain-containing protein [Shewanella electrodiphila]MCL1043856.1 VWA domain-containing protein [Shewanella electrodiphila]